MFSLLKNVLKKKTINSYKKIVRQINKKEDSISLLSDFDLKKQFYKTSSDYKNHKITQQDFLINIFSITREASKRTLKMRHFDVQLIGGLALYHGNIAEMQTGEGKTIVAVLAAAAIAAKGKKVHIITVNDYLVKRDSHEMSKVYSFLGLSTGYITEETDHENRASQYDCDILYSTSSNIGFDFLRDNMASSKKNFTVLKHGLKAVIIDEVDSVLIDEARTPLVISGSQESIKIDYKAIQSIVSKLEKIHFEIEEKSNQIFLTELGNDEIENKLKEKKIIPQNQSIFSIENCNILNTINQSLKANFLFQENKDYIVKNKNVYIVDEFTGRVMEDRRYSDGLHQAIEIKEGIKRKNESQTLASITLQNLFRKYSHICGMTGTALTEEDEFLDIYGLKVISISPNKATKRVDHDDVIFINKDIKNKALVEEIKNIHSQGRPILIGTADISKSEEISSILRENAIKHNILNAKNHEKEAHIIAQAGRLNAITVATNMAGRGTNILLGGNLNFLLEESKIDPKSDLARELEEELKQEKQQVIDLGGLCILASERHENRRIDNQLRGRSGRQGDPGSSKFFLSTEDDLLRIFGGEKIGLIMSKIGFEKEESINHPMINGVVSRSQKKIENMNYEIRKNLLKYDDITNISA